MNVCADALEELMALGVEGPALVAAIRRLEQAAYGDRLASLQAAVDAASSQADRELEERRAQARERQAKHRSKGPSVTVTSRHVTERDEPAKESPQTPKKTTPFPPLKGGTSPIEPAAVAPTVETLQPDKPTAESKPLSAWVSEIWEITPRTARVRTSKADIERQLRAAVKRGREPGAVLAGLEAYYASPDATTQDGKFAKGAHTVIANDRWEAFAEDAAPGRSAAPAGPPEDPWPKRLLGWNASAYWHSDWGPKPGKPGCLVPAEHLQRQEVAA